MGTEAFSQNEEQLDRMDNGFEKALTLFVDGKEVKQWGSHTFKDDVHVEVTREECKKIAGDKPWALIVVDTSMHRNVGDDPGMWEGMTKEQVYALCRDSQQNEDARERREQEKDEGEEA